MAIRRIIQILMASQTRNELGKIRNWKQFFGYLKIFLLYIVDVLFGRYKSEHGARKFIILALVYIISPIDIIPDYILFWGQLDDIFIFTRIIKKFKQDLLAYSYWKGIDLVAEVGYGGDDSIITVTAEEVLDSDNNED